MRVYWSDREGNPAPPNCCFHLRSFCSKLQISSDAKQVILPPPTKAKILNQSYLPERNVWIENVQSVLKKNIPKVVLARRLFLELDHAPDPFALTAALKKKAVGAFVFCIEFDGGAFLGASPERLFTRNNQVIFSEAVAGTRPRGKTPQEDEILGKDLLTSKKDFNEIQPVQMHIEETLKQFCTQVVKSPLSIHKTQNVQHLYGTISGTLRPFISDEEIVNHLHPTPALAGYPKKEALAYIQELEPFERGLYGGAIGWSTPDAAEWIVGIRSCLLKGNQATLFSGTGIVEGSIAEEEWDELNQKLKLYDGIFDH